MKANLNTLISILLLGAAYLRQTTPVAQDGKPDPVEIVGYNSSWVREFDRYSRFLTHAESQIATGANTPGLISGAQYIDGLVSSNPYPSYIESRTAVDLVADFNAFEQAHAELVLRCATVISAPLPSIEEQ